MIQIYVCKELVLSSSNKSNDINMICRYVLNFFKRWSHANKHTMKLASIGQEHCLAAKTILSCIQMWDYTLITNNLRISTIYYGRTDFFFLSSRFNFLLARVNSGPTNPSTFVSYSRKTLISVSLLSFFSLHPKLCSPRPSSPLFFSFPLFLSFTFSHLLQ